MSFRFGFTYTHMYIYFKIYLFIIHCSSSHSHLYLKTETDNDGKEIIGNASCVTRFISSLILLMEHGAKAHLRHLSEFFGLLFEFSRMGDEETVFLLRIGVIKSVVDFYLGNKIHDNVSEIPTYISLTFDQFNSKHYVLLTA